MALCAWFPLTGTLDNQGTDNVSFTTTNASFQNDGKLGKCLKLGYSSNFTVPSLVKSKQISIAYWLRVNTATSTNWLDSIHYYTNPEGGTGTGSVTRQELYNNCTTTGFWFDNGSIISIPVTVGQWAHFAITVDYEAGIAKVYKDGVLQGTSTSVTKTTQVTGNNFRIGENGLDLSENDVRIYNHILSPKEVEILARGLVLHYPLSDPYVEDTTNNTPSGDCLSNICYNDANGKYGYGTNTDMYKVVGTYEGRYCTRLYMGTAGQPARPYPYIANLFVSQGGSQAEWKTLSFDFFCTIGTYIYPYRLGSGSSNCTWTNSLTGSGSFANQGNIPVIAGEWQHISMTLHGTTSASAEWGYITMGDTHTSDPSNSWLFANMQLEYKDHETGYTNGGTTRSDRITYDTSGYSHNGTNTSSLTTNSNSSRYGTCTYFENDTNAITAPITIGNGSAITLSCWVRSKNGSQGKGGYQMPLNINGGTYEFSIPNSGKFRQGFFINGTRYVNDYGSTNLLDKNWHMISATYDGTNIKRYIDGILVNTTAVTGTLATGALNLCIGKYYGSTIYGNVELYESDIRIYTTALTAAQIAELYNTAVSLSNNGSLLGYEFVET